MKQKKMHFSLRLLWEGFQQCKMIGIFSAVIVVLGAVLEPVAQAISLGSSPHYTKVVYEAWGINVTLLVVLLAAPLMTLMLFHFLDNRAASDLYHALPHKRITLYLSYAGAVLLWVVLLLVLGTLTSVIACGFTHKYITLLMDSLLPFAASLFCMSFLMVAGMLVSMSITGTVFTNLLFAGILLFLPRLCVLALQSSMVNALPFLSDSAGTGFFRNANNLLFSGVNVVFSMSENDGTSIETVFSPSWQAYLYTFLLGLLYFAIAAFLFHRRRSEAAGQSAPSRLLQHIYRIVVTMVICIFIVCVMFSEMTAGILRDEWFVFLVFYLVAALVYFAYELITTKKWKNLLTALPGLGIVALLNVGILLGMHAVEKHIVAQRPAMQEIESVSFCSTDGTDYISGGNYLNYRDYINLMSRDIAITDPTAVTLVSYYLDENLKTWEEGGSNAYQSKYYTESDYSYCAYHVIIRTKDQTLCRLIYVPVSETEKLLDALQTNADYVDAWRNPPQELKGTAAFRDQVGSCYLSTEQAEELLQTYREELQSADFETLYQTMQNGSTDDTWVSDIDYTFRKNGRSYTLDCAIYQNLTPETTKKFYEMLYAAQKDNLALLSELTKSDKNVSVNMNAYGGSSDSAYSGHYAYASDCQPLNQSESLQLLMQYAILDRPMQAGESYVELYLWSEDGLMDQGNAIDLQIPIKDSFFDDPQTEELFSVENYNEYDFSDAELGDYDAVEAVG